MGWPIFLWLTDECAQDNYPKMGITQLDLSPFYLQKARDNMDYWRQRRGGSNPADSVAHKDKFLQAPAEEIPVADASYDIVSPSIYSTEIIFISGPPSVWYTDSYCLSHHRQRLRSNWQLSVSVICFFDSLPESVCVIVQIMQLTALERFAVVTAALKIAQLAMLIKLCSVYGTRFGWLVKFERL